MTDMTFDDIQLVSVFPERMWLQPDKGLVGRP